MSDIEKNYETIQKDEKRILNMKEENKIIRHELKDLQKMFEAKEKEWTEVQDSIVHELNNHKRRCCDQESLIGSLKGKINKLEEKLVLSSNQMMGLKQTMKEKEEDSKGLFDSMQAKYELKLTQYKDYTKELKESIEELLEVKTMVLTENKTMKENIEKQDDMTKRRRLLLRSEMREV